MVIEDQSPEFTVADPPHCDICGKFTAALTDGACARCYEVWRSTPPEPESVDDWDCCDEHMTTFLKGDVCQMCIEEAPQA